MKVMILALFLLFSLIMAALFVCHKGEKNKELTVPKYRLVMRRLESGDSIYRIERYIGNSWTFFNDYKSKEVAMNSIKNLEKHGTEGEVIYQTETK